MEEMGRAELQEHRRAAIDIQGLWQEPGLQEQPYPYGGALGLVPHLLHCFPLLCHLPCSKAVPEMLHACEGSPPVPRLCVGPWPFCVRLSVRCPYQM